MKTLTMSALLTFSLLANASTPSPYAGQESREIKSLSPTERADILAGKGMGLAKTAELNGYPGPLHVLELAKELQLTDDQKARTEALFKAMQSRAQAVGRQLIDAERTLDTQFDARKITRAQLAESLKTIASLQAQLRAVHLEAHLDQVDILTPKQTKKYVDLRGYAKDGGAHASHEHGHKH